MQKIFNVIVVLLAIAVGYLMFAPSKENMGAVVGGAEFHKMKQNFAAGFQVNSSDVISSALDLTLAGDANFDDANTTTTVALGNTGVGKLCLYNGANYSIISFSSNSTTVATATSTSCQ